MFAAARTEANRAIFGKLINIFIENKINIVRSAAFLDRLAIFIRVNRAKKHIATVNNGHFLLGKEFFDFSGEFDTDRTTTDEVYIFGRFDLFPPSVDVRAKRGCIGKIQRARPNRSRREHKRRVGDSLAALKYNLAPCSRLCLVDGDNLALVVRAVSVDEEVVEGDERPVGDIVDVRDGHASGGDEVDGIWAVTDEDEVVLVRVEFGGERAGKEGANQTSADDHDVLPVVVLLGHDGKYGERGA